jgi:hypothetical protein
VREQLTRVKVQALGVAYVRISIHQTLIVHKPPSNLAPYQFKLRFKPSLFVCKPFLEWFLKQPTLSKLTFQNNFSGKDTTDSNRGGKNISLSGTTREH